MRYVALLRGINVGGKSLLKMEELRRSVESLGYQNVRTYINSGNVIFETDEVSSQSVARSIENALQESFQLTVRVVVYSASQYRRIVESAPAGWGEKPDWKYNTLFLIPPYDIEDIKADIGGLKPDIETLHCVEGAIYQAMLFTKFGQTTTGKLASRPSYQKMTVRNWNTTRKLLAILQEK